MKGKTWELLYCLPWVGGPVPDSLDPGTQCPPTVQRRCPEVPKVGTQLLCFLVRHTKVFFFLSDPDASSWPVAVSPIQVL